MTGSDQQVERVPSSTASLGSALFISTLIAVVLGALAFWPKSAWAPPSRPALRAPIVFDEFVARTAAPASSSSVEPTAH